jgi:hypothetical protein
MKKLNNKKIFIHLAGTVPGALVGYLYYSKFGCVPGGCLITSNPYISALYGAFFGYLISDFFIGKTNAEPKKENINL